MQLAQFLPVLALLGAGSVLAIQAPINAALARGLGDPVVAACINFFMGFLVLLIVNLIRGSGPQDGAFTLTPLWAFVGGALGACYIVSLIWAIPQTDAHRRRHDLRATGHGPHPRPHRRLRPAGAGNHLAPRRGSRPRDVGPAALAHVKRPGGSLRRTLSSHGTLTPARATAPPSRPRPWRYPAPKGRC